jgi:hypothetical protein
VLRLVLLADAWRLLHRAWRWNNGVPGWKCQRVGPYKAEKNYETYDVGVPAPSPHSARLLDKPTRSLLPPILRSHNLRHQARVNPKLPMEEGPVTCPSSDFQWQPTTRRGLCSRLASESTSPLSHCPSPDSPILRSHNLRHQARVNPKLPMEEGRRRSAGLLRRIWTERNEERGLVKSSSPAAVEIFHGHRAWRWNNGVPGWNC